MNKQMLHSNTTMFFLFVLFAFVECLFFPSIRIHAAMPPVNCSTPAGLGLSNPTDLCLPSNPCDNLLMTYASKSISQISTPMFSDFECKGWIRSPIDNKWKQYIDGPAPKTISIPSSIPLSQDPHTRNRVYCEFIPATASPTNQVPVVIVVHGSGGNASTVMYGGTNWRFWAEEREFAVITTQSMNRHWPASGVIGAGEDGTKNEYLYRHLDRNDDIVYFDTLIDSLVSTGKIDRNRIYMSGWSNGDGFATFYSNIRSGSTDTGSYTASPPFNQNFVFGHTPIGKNMIAALSAFSGPDPWYSPWWNFDCHTPTIPKTTLPVMQVSRLCDIVKCANVEKLYKRIRDDIGSANSTWLLVDENDNVLPHSDCAEKYDSECSASKDVAGHMKWPIGQMPAMIDFLMRYSSTSVSSSTSSSVATTSTSIETSSSSSTTMSSSSASTTTKTSSIPTSTPSSSSQSSSSSSSAISSTSTSMTTLMPSTTTSTSTLMSSSSPSSTVSPPTSNLATTTTTTTTSTTATTTTTMTSTNPTTSTTITNQNNQNNNNNNAATQDPSSSFTQQQNNTGVIIGAVLGSIIGIACLVFVVKMFRGRNVSSSRGRGARSYDDDGENHASYRSFTGAAGMQQFETEL